MITDLLSVHSIGLSPFTLEGTPGDSAVLTVRHALQERLTETSRQAAMRGQELAEQVRQIGGEVNGARELAHILRESGSELNAISIERQAINLMHVLRDVLHELSTFNARSPFEIAYFVLRTAWIEILSDIERKGFLLSHSQLKSLEYYRLLKDEALDIIERKDDDVSTLLLRRLLCSNRPEILGDLFLICDQQANAETTAAPQRRRLMDNVGSEAGAVMLPEPSVWKKDDLVPLFLAGPGSELCGTDHDFDALEYMLANFLAEFPLTQLRTPERVADAVQKWVLAESRRNIVPSKRHWRRKALDRFLQFLEHRALIPAVPKVIHLAKAFFGRTISSLKELRAISALLGLLAMAAGLAGLSLIIVAPPLSNLPRSGQLIDLIVFGGLLTHAALTAPIIGALLLGPLAVKAVLPGASLIAHLRGIGGLLGKWVLVPAITASMIFFGFDGHVSVYGIINFVWVVVVCIFLFNVARTFIVFADTEIGLSLYNCWFGVVAALLLYHLLTVLGWWEAVFATIAAVAALTIVRTRTAIFSLPCYSRQIRDSYTLVGDEVAVDLVVLGPRLTEASIYAAIISYTLWDFVERSYGLEIAAGSFVILALMIQLVLTSKACNARLWREHMTNHWQRFAGSDNMTLDTMLRRNKRKLVMIDAGFLIVSVGLWYAVDKKFVLTETFGAPIPIIAVPAVIILVYSSSNFLMGVWRIVSNRGIFEVPDFAYVNQEQEEGLSLLENIQLALSNRILLLLTVAIIILRGADLVREFWKLLHGG